MNKTKLLMSALMTSLVLMTSVAKAQQVKGTNYINAGIGIGTFGFTGTGGVPVVASVEHGISGKVSAGIYLGFIQRKFVEEFKYKYLVIGARGSYHLNEELNITNSKIDVYGGAALYYRSFTVKYKGTATEDDFKSNGGDMGVGIFAAGRYMFAKNAGAFAEIGYGISPLQLGATFRF